MSGHFIMESESLSASENQTRMQKSFDAVLRNLLLVDQICSSATAAVLLNLRLVNGLFYRQATRRLSKMNHEPIDLGIESSTVEKFIARMKTRFNPEEINSFPFSSFKLDLRHSAKTIGHFAAEIGQQVTRLYLHSPSEDEESNHQLHKKLISILSHVPHLTEIRLKSQHPIQMSNADLPDLPQSFPQLRVISLDHRCSSRTAPNSIPLLALMISRATRLDKVKILRIYPNQYPEINDGLAALRALSQHHKAYLPAVFWGRIPIRPLPLIQELNCMKLSFKNLHPIIKIYPNDFSDTAEIQNLLRNFSDYMATQTLSLETLHFEIVIRDPRVAGAGTLTVPIPPLAALTEFCCCIMIVNESNNGSSSTTLFIPLASNQFPALRIFQLHLRNHDHNLHNTAVRFEVSPQPSVQKFSVNRTPSLFESNPWHIIFPNLSSISIYFTNTRRDCDNEDDLRYILKHFPRLSCLELNFETYSNMGPDYWRTLTGGAPRHATDVLLYDDFDPVAEELEDPINGIYQTASLSNFRVLQTFKCRPASRGNLNAIVYMTRKGRLCPLDKLIITGLGQDLRMEAEEMTMYRDLLALEHTDVCLMNEMAKIKRRTLCNCMLTM